MASVRLQPLVEPQNRTVEDLHAIERSPPMKWIPAVPSLNQLSQSGRGKYPDVYSHTPAKQLKAEGIGLIRTLCVHAPRGNRLGLLEPDPGVELA
jgi:hypothetical protein